MLLTHHDNALIVDCGGANALKNGVYINHISDHLININTVKIIVTHEHTDHYNGIQQMRRIVERINKNRLMYNNANQRNILQTIHVEVQHFNTHNTLDAKNFLANALGSDVGINCLIPDNIEDTLLNCNDKHQVNLVIIVSYQGRSILLPGDANSTLFAYHCWYTDNFCGMIQNCDVVLLPHHGSWKNGEQFWLGNMLERENRLYIISSDPYGKHHLPKMQYIGKLIAKIPQKSAEHDFSCAFAITYKNGNQEPVDTPDNLIVVQTITQKATCTEIYSCNFSPIPL